MQCSVTVTVEVGAEDRIDELEERVVQAGRAAMRAALGAAVRACEEQQVQQSGCPRCGPGARVRAHGTVRRVVLTRFGRLRLALRRLRCGDCGMQFRPARACLAELQGANVTRELAASCALAGASWAYTTAARMLHRLSGAQVSAEEVRRLTIAAGTAAAEDGRRKAEQVVAPTAAAVRAERERHQPSAPSVERLVVGMDGGWVPSREQAGGMEGKVGVVSTGVEAVGKHGRHHLTPRRLVATFLSSEQLGALAYAAATELGAVGGDGPPAREQVVLGDGAHWIHEQAAWHFPDALGILDWAHVERALHQAIRAALPGRANRPRRREVHRAIPEHLWHGDVDATVAALVALRPAASPPPASASSAAAEPVARLEETIAYVQAQRAWLGDYAAWQEAGYPVGSGLVERAVFVVINRRMKRQGMRWRRANADAVVALRTRELNADGDPFDEQLRSSLAA